MAQTPSLLPIPRHITLNHGYIQLTYKQLICLDCTHPNRLLFPARRVQQALLAHLGLNYELNASPAVPEDRVGILLRLAPGLDMHPQGYSLDITPADITLQAKDEAGLFYGCCTLVQLIQNYWLFTGRNGQLPPGSLPCLHITDWPDFPNRGYMLDVSRDKVPTMETLYDLVDLLASWKINQLQLYTEHTFAYQNHPEAWADASPFTGEEILELDAYCRDRYIELVPNQNSFGHLEHWLKLPGYQDLAEAPGGFELPWGEHHPGPFGLCPIDPGSLNLVSSLYDELLPHFTSRQFNVGCDETFDLGQGRSKAACDEYGTGRVYLDFLLKIYHQVVKRGFTMQFWGDIVMAHPELVSELPKDCIALEWGYDANHPFDKHTAQFAQAGLPFYVCPGTSAWNSISGRTENCLKNIANAAIYGHKNGAIGLLNTDWGDDGHWQVQLVSYLGIAAGAAYAWTYEANQDLDLPSVLNLYAFQDSSGHFGEIAYDLGNVYREIGIQLENTSTLFEILKRPVSEWRSYPGLDHLVEKFSHALEVIDQISRHIPDSTSRRPDRELLKREFLQTARLLRHACLRGLFGLGSQDISASFLRDDLEGILQEHQAIWLLRNRPGGLQDSLSRFNIAMADYR